MTKKILTVLPAIFLLASCGKKTPECASPEAMNHVQKQVAQQLIKAGATGYSEPEISGMISIANIQTVSADSNVDSYKCKATATITYPGGLAERITAVSDKKGALLYEIPKMLAEKYGLSAVGMSTQLAAIVMTSTMQGTEVKDAFTAALEKDNKSDVAYDIFKMEKAKNNVHYGVSGQLADTDFVEKTVFYMNIAPVIMSYGEQEAIEKGVDAKPEEQTEEAAPTPKEVKPAAETSVQPEATAQPETKPAVEAESTEVAKPEMEVTPETEAKPTEKAEEPKPLAEEKPASSTEK